MVVCHFHTHLLLFYYYLQSTMSNRYKNRCGIVCRDRNFSTSGYGPSFFKFIIIILLWRSNFHLSHKFLGCLTVSYGIGYGMMWQKSKYILKKKKTNL